jgi:hypothetical protein
MIFTEGNEVNEGAGALRLGFAFYDSLTGNLRMGAGTSFVLFVTF